MASRLFEPLRLRGVSFRNRIVVSPMCQYSGEDGRPGDWHIQHYGSLATSGPGLLMIEATAVGEAGRITKGCLGIYSDANEAAMARLIRAIRTTSDVPVGIQLIHAGRKGSARPPWEGGQPLAVEDGGWQTISASARAFGPGWHTPAEATLDDIAAIGDAFGDAASRAIRAGADLVEVHVAHGYLLHQFLSPISNHRSDAYGGKLENRMRFALEVIAKARRAVPDDKVLGMRLSANDWLEGGFNPEEAILFVEAAARAGIDYVCVSTGGISADAKIPLGPGYQSDFAAAIRRATGVPTRAVGLITDPQQAEDLLEAGKADFVVLGRAFLNDPRWVWRAALTLGEPVSSPRQYLAARHTAISPMEVSLPPGTMATTSTQPLAPNAPSGRLFKGMIK